MIGTIETAIVDRLKGAELGYKMLVSTFKANDDEDIAVVLKNSRNAALVVFAGESLTEDDGGYGAITAVTFAVLLFARNVRNERASRSGDGGAVGAYQMIEDVKALLHGNDLGLDIVPLKHLRTSPLTTENVKGFNHSAWLVEFSTAYSFKPYSADGDGNLAEFIRLHTAWDLPEPEGTTTDLILREGVTND